MIDCYQGRSDRETAGRRHQDRRVDPHRAPWNVRPLRPQGGRPRHLGQGQHQAGMALGHDAAARVGDAIGGRAGSGVGGRAGRDAVVAVRAPVGRTGGGDESRGGGLGAGRSVRGGRSGARRELAHRRPGKGDRQNQRQAEQHVPDPGEGHLARHSIGPARRPPPKRAHRATMPALVGINVAPFCPRPGRRAVNSRQKN